MLAFLIYITICCMSIYSSHQNDPRVISSNFQRIILKTENQVWQKVEVLKNRFDTNSNVFPVTFNDPVLGLGDDKIYLFVFNLDSIIFWSTNKIILPEKFNSQWNDDQQVLKLKNGWYGFQGIRSGNYLFLGCYLIKSEFLFQNDFVKNKFSSRFNCPETISIEIKKGRHPIFSSSGIYLFSLNFSQYNGNQVVHPFFFFFLFVIGSLCFFYFIYRVYHVLDWFIARKNLMVVLFCVDILLLRVLQYWLGFPRELTQSELFSPALYSSTAILPSLGDFTINIILVFVMCLVIYFNISIHQKGRLIGERRKLLINSVAIIIILFFFHVVGYLITDLVINSSLTLNLQNISELTYESGYGLFNISIMLFSFWLISTRVFDDLFSAAYKQKFIVLSAGIAAILYCLICWIIFGRVDSFNILFFFIYLGSYWYFKSKQQTIFSVMGLVFFVCFFAVFTTLILNRANDQKENEKRDLLSVKLATRRNPVTELLYEQLERKLLADSVLRGFFRPTQTGNIIKNDGLIKYLKVQYFKDHWKKYNIQVTVCDSMKDLRVQPQGYLINCNTYFHGILKNYGEATLLPNLFFLDYGFGKEYYIAVLSEKQFNTNALANLSVIIEFNLLNSYPDPGYPGLLMDNTRVDIPNLSDYSYGLFQEGRLVHSVGAYSYKTELGQYKAFSPLGSFFADDQMIHYYYPINDTNSLLISKNEKAFLTMISPFSYLFILFTVIALMASGIVYFPQNPHFVPSSLRNRLHFSLIGVLIVTLIVIGIVQIINIININSKKNSANLREKAYSVQVEVQHRYSTIRDINEVSKNDLEDFLIKLSNVFFTDINFYNDKGALKASSRQQIFEEGLISERMNPEAHRKLIIEKGSAFIQSESIGNMQFSSAYLPLYNEQNRLLGYINLPYFSRQDELKKEISSFLVTFINIYILLLLFGVFITILISNYITAPLSMLAEKISRLRLGVVNEKIDWNHSDEIGQLVSEYNRMIDELWKSAEMLAQSERESAWREMARQVAHEIKNPLTPMKLSAQYLQKAWNNKAPDMGERLERFTKTLIEQIDTLSAIASDFSNFAKMPEVVNERVDLEELIHFVLSMYKDTSEISYNFISVVSDRYIWADRALLVRIFTNLLNNAVQAIGESPNGMVSIRLSRENQQFIIAVSDTGSGISIERAGKIFQPDFTTKTGGMGLGLAIVKGIVTGMNGEISFTSEEQKGATFIIKLPSDV